MAEPGFWFPTDNEVEGLQAYLRKGGFVIFDDSLQTIGTTLRIKWNVFCQDCDRWS
ncbi:MAG: hypothetical protein Ct9H300mP25_00390 [Acidobacteriota bacterium]|nr:MAG: hypothetical protein Ct9H300mP25_00390 [Acidobacteriota bacterium]